MPSIIDFEKEYLKNLNVSKIIGLVKDLLLSNFNSYDRYNLPSL